MEAGEQDKFHQDLWKTQEDEPMQFRIEEVCTRARKYERENILVYWAMLCLTPLLGAGFIWNLIRLHEPWLIAGQVWMLAMLCLAGFGSLRRRPNRVKMGEPCIQFLRREFERKQQSLRLMRWWVVWLVPGILASWWGGGPMLRAKSLGIRSTWILRLHKGPAPLIVMALLLAFVWFSFWRQGRKADHELERLRRE